MTGDLDKTIRAYETERQVYVNLSTASDRPPPAVDILELYAGTAKPTMFAKECGLRAAQPLDIEYGMDLSDTGVQAQVRKAVDRLHPWLLVIGYPCTHYNLMNENANYHHRMDVLNQIRHDDAPMRKFVRDLMLRQHSSGRLFLLENPATSRLWKQTVNAVFQVQQVSNGAPLSRLMILDAACQRTCCGLAWLSSHVQLLRDLGLAMYKHPAGKEDRFQFGKGQPVTPEYRACFPATIGGKRIIIGAGALNANIPLLGSNVLLDALGMVLDLPQKRVHFAHLSTSVPVLCVNGRLQTS